MSYQTEVVKADYKGSLNSQVLKEKGLELLKILKKDKAVLKAAELLKKGEIVALPTETVYGLAADAKNPSAVEKIFSAKGRPQDNPLIVHVGSEKQLSSLIKGDISLKAQLLIDRFWPGPLTIIFNKGAQVPNITSAGLATVAVRMPAHPLILAVIQKSGLPLAAPSANTSGYPSPTKAQHVYADLKGKIPMILDGGSCEVGVESTVIDIRGDKPVILRPGAVSRIKISNLLEEEVILNSSHKKRTAAPAPGMKYRHYAPEKNLYIFRSEDIRELLQKISQKKAAVIVSKQTEIPEGIEDNIKLLKAFSRKEPAQLGRKLYSLLRELDADPNVEEIYIEKIKAEGIGEAVMNRIYKAAAAESHRDPGGGENQ